MYQSRYDIVIWCMIVECGCDIRKFVKVKEI